MKIKYSKYRTYVLLILPFYRKQLFKRKHLLWNIGVFIGLNCEDDGFSPVYLFYYDKLLFSIYIEPHIFLLTTLFCLSLSSLPLILFHKGISLNWSAVNRWFVQAFHILTLSFPMISYSTIYIQIWSVYWRLVFIRLCQYLNWVLIINI